MTKEEIQDSIGKMVCVKHNGTEICGELQFAGENPNFASWGFQLTIDRMPIPNVDVNTVSLCIERESIVKKRIVSEEEILKLAKEAKDRFGSTLEKLGNS